MAAKKKVAKKAAEKKVRGKNKPKAKLLTKRVAKTARAIKVNDLVVITKGVRKHALGFVIAIEGKHASVGFGAGSIYEGDVRVSSLRHATKIEAGSVRHFAILLTAAKPIAVAQMVVESAAETKAINDQITDSVTQVAVEDDSEDEGDTLTAAEDDFNTLAI